MERPLEAGGARRGAGRADARAGGAASSERAPPGARTGRELEPGGSRPPGGRGRSRPRRRRLPAPGSAPLRGRGDLGSRAASAGHGGVEPGRGGAAAPRDTRGERGRGRAVVPGRELRRGRGAGRGWRTGSRRARRRAWRPPLPFSHSFLEGWVLPWARAAGLREVSGPGARWRSSLSRWRWGARGTDTETVVIRRARRERCGRTEPETRQPQLAVLGCLPESARVWALGKSSQPWDLNPLQAPHALTKSPAEGTRHALSELSLLPASAKYEEGVTLRADSRGSRDFVSRLLV